jgi:adenylate cyclase
MTPLNGLRNLMEGAVPAAVATCSPDGTPNVSFISQLHYVDDSHVALSFQFFSKTRENVLANPRATVLAIDPETAAQYRFELEYLRTDTEGPLFESMKAKLAGIASHSGMTGVFRLLGADLYRVLDVEKLIGGELQSRARPNLLPAARAIAERIARCADLASLLDELLSALEATLSIRHAKLLLTDAGNRQLYTVASRGYEHSGIGAEIAFGDGVIGVAAQNCTPIRLTHAAAEYSYGRALRQRAEAGGLTESLTTQIPFAGLERCGSQLAVPITACGQLIGVLYVESPEEQRFRYDDEDALAAIAPQVGLAIRLLQQAEEREEAPTQVPAEPARAAGAVVSVRHYPENDSVFIGDEYLIKGVAGAIFWKLLRDYSREGRVEFTNRELRLDASIRLPELSENLEARLILLQRRLAERSAFIRLERCGRGRLRLVVTRSLRLLEDGSVADDRTAQASAASSLPRSGAGR